MMSLVSESLELGDFFIFTPKNEKEKEKKEMEMNVEEDTKC